MFGCLFFIIISLVVSQNESARILAVFPTASISHQVAFRPLTQELARRGHELTIWTADPAFAPGEAPPNITEIDLHDESYKMVREVIVSYYNNADKFHSVRRGSKYLTESFEMQLKSDEVQHVLKTKTFDLLIVEACARAALMVSLIVKDVPIIQISSFGAWNPNLQIHGVPLHPILYPDSLVQTKIHNLTVFEKINLLREDYEIKNILVEDESFNAAIRRQFGDSAPTIKELEDKVDLLFLNFHSIWDGNRPVPPGVIYLGGLHDMKPAKKLPDDLKNYLDSSKHGVIYMSFGTNVFPSMLPPEKIQEFFKVFSKLPYDVMLKWDKDEVAGRPDNVRIFKWLPQSELLRHPKIKLFITQGGLQSSDEAITAGVPLIAFPMLADQWFNAEKYMHHKIGLKLDIKTVTEHILSEAINQILNDPSYRENAKKLGIIMHDQPQNSLERAVWWTEYVIRHKGAKHLRSPAANMHWTEYYMMDVVAVIGLGAAITFVIAIILVILIFKFVNNLLRSNKKTKSS